MVTRGVTAIPFAFIMTLQTTFRHTASILNIKWCTAKCSCSCVMCCMPMFSICHAIRTCMQCFRVIIQHPVCGASSASASVCHADFRCVLSLHCVDADEMMFSVPAQYETDPVVWTLCFGRAYESQVIVTCHSMSPSSAANSIRLNCSFINSSMSQLLY